jgi:hypothetical protein
MDGPVRFKFGNADYQKALQVHYCYRVHCWLRRSLQLFKLSAKEFQRVWRLLRHHVSRMPRTAHGKPDEIQSTVQTVTVKQFFDLLDQGCRMDRFRQNLEMMSC